VCAPHRADIGINLFNFSFNHPLAEMRQLAGDSVVLLGNLPTVEVLADGSPEQVGEAVTEMKNSVDDLSRIILSCGGGMPPNVSTENIRAFLEAARQ
jgi:uroporphyrinogen decarboxylase